MCFILQFIRHNISYYYACKIEFLYLIINTLEQENNADNIGLIILTPPKNSKYLYKLVENGVDNKIKLY
jgi:hypothetical protein